MIPHEPFLTCGQCAGQTLLIEMSRCLPTDPFECRHCGAILARRHAAPTVYPTGFVVPGKITVDVLPFLSAQ